jgi:hypothetical protein
MKKYLVNVFVILLFFNVAVQAQDEINIDPSKGHLGLKIPLHVFKMPDFSVEVGLSYSGRGYRVKSDYSSFVGWQFYGAGAIRRILKGLPDEKVYSSGDQRRGWLNGTTYSNVAAFTVTDNNDEFNCADEETNMNNLSPYSDYKADLEPDIFQVQAPGLSCQLMVDHSGNFKALPAKELKVEFVAGNPK